MSLDSSSYNLLSSDTTAGEQTHKYWQGKKILLNLTFVKFKRIRRRVVQVKETSSFAGSEKPRRNNQSFYAPNPAVGVVFPSPAKKSYRKSKLIFSATL